MAISVFRQTAKTSTNSNDVTTTAIDTSGAALIVVCLSDYSFAGAASADITDNQSNSWTRLTQQTSSAGYRVALYYCVNPVTSATHTFTSSRTASYPALSVLAMSGTATSSPFDQQNGATVGSVTTIAPGSVTPTQNNEIVITAITFNNASATVSIDSGFSSPTQAAPSAGLGIGGGIAYLVQTTAGAANPTWTETGSAAEKSAAIATFKEAATGSTPSPAAGALVLSGKTPSLVLSLAMLAGAGALSLQGLAPTVAIGGGNVTPAPAAGSITLTGYAPSLTFTIAPSPSAGSLALAGQAPTLTIGSGPAPSPTTATLTLAGLQPTLTRVDFLTPSPATGPLVLAGYAPSLSIGGVSATRIVSGTSTVTLVAAGNSTVTLLVAGSSTAGG